MGRSVIRLFYWIVLLMTAADQISKLFIRSMMDAGDTYTVWSGILEFQYYQNSGAARSLFQGYGRFFGIVALIFMLGVFYYRKNKFPLPRLLDIGLAFLVAGAAGNGIERLWYGKVTDFLVFGEGQGILNIADLSINVGVLLVIVDQLFLSRSNKKRDRMPPSLMT
ncbi:signal peptidase II [Cohnella sp. CFH 77786]|uniref:signal peptidase II n=1 Tax=Cohnella sp. CFH 77786 TaxID=2662265 RepID=UPI001C60A130|nr:signal peptidase II [Cohnella sp. CFH 77786]MBW5447194.1 signal peptidase II [Cohnella sp. CFH 77786]